MLHLAASKTESVWLEKLLKLSNIDIESKDLEGYTPLHVAVLNKTISNVEILLQNGAAADSVGKEGNTPLHLAVIHSFAECLEIWKIYPLCVERKNLAGKTCLHLAAERGHENILKCLLDMGADVEAKDNEGNTPIKLAANDNCRKILADFGAQTGNINKLEGYPNFYNVKIASPHARTRHIPQTNDIQQDTKSTGHNAEGVPLLEGQATIKDQRSTSHGKASLLSDTQSQYSKRSKNPFCCCFCKQ